MPPISQRLGGRSHSTSDDSQRPRMGPDRSHSGSYRAEPYPQSRLDPSTLTSWKRGGSRVDLFDESSSTYNIRLNQGLFPHADPPAPEVSRRVEHVPEDVERATIAAPLAVNTPSAATDLADRFLPGSTGAARPASAPAIPHYDPAAEQRARRVQQQKEHEERRLRMLAEDEAKKRLQQQQARDRFQKKIADFESKGFVIQVEGLVYGTSADDVQTAFGAYGETTYCYIVNEDTAREDDPLIARLTFKQFDSAAEACAKLHGAIADGRELTVKQVERTPYPPTSTDILGVAPTSSVFVSTSYSAPVSHAQPSRPDPSTQYADTRFANPSRSMHDDDGMDVDMSEFTPARSSTAPPARNQPGPAHRGGARGGGGAARNGPTDAAQNTRSNQHPPTGPKGQGPAQAPATTSLLDRLGGGNIRGGHPAGRQGESGRGRGGNGTRQAQKGGSANSGSFQSLVARMS
ncbi:BQ2448_812 [Microbotryum intermedium]|uniref:BQ2448_812 protein n=1 Tax=Microbotryum intermedium TaxID=269621 RepID=A0A238F9A3_9BASI|nr:BQ2448_812 [Microbotryum intermedium]